MSNSFKLKKEYVLILSLIAAGFLSCLMLFARPFVGIGYKGILLGQLLIAVTFLISFTSFLPYINKITREYLGDKFILVYRFIILIFVILSILSNSSFLKPYTYKTSSYVWTFSILFLSILLFDVLEIKINYFFPILIIPLFIYLFSTGHYPDVIINFFKSNSDKFQFLKASDLMITVICVNQFCKTLIKNNYYRLIYLCFTTALFTPLLLFMSRGSFIGLLLFFIFELFYTRELIKRDYIKSLAIFIFTFVIFISSLFYIDYLYVNEETKSLSYEENIQLFLQPGFGSSLSNSVTDLALKDESRKIFLSFYIHYGRIESKDPTTNWRLDIWQDITFDLFEEGKVFTGYGYREILPQMTDPTAPGRLGRDGLNENVHSYVVNILARGGILHFIAFAYLYFSMIKKWRVNIGNYKLLGFILPVMLTASLDIAMEGVQFPIIFFFTLGYLLVYEKNNLTNTSNMNL